MNTKSFRQWSRQSLTGGLTVSTGLIALLLTLNVSGSELTLQDIEKMKPMELTELSTPEEFIRYAHSQSVDIHDLFFELRPYENTESCMTCHEDEAVEMLDTGHFKWAGKIVNISGLEGEVHGKKDLLNNFCIATATNEPRCSQCHVGYGYKDDSYDFHNPANVDCLVCHDQSGTYKKNPKTAGLPDASVDLNVVARSISIGSEPTRKACIGCHATAGGGDNVKHGDISTDLVATTREYDVHMGTDGANFSCVDCHGANHDPETGAVNHGIAGMSLHSVYEGEMKQCTDCHGEQQPIHAGTTAEEMFTEGWHTRLACQTCHIPAIARKVPTKVEWYWSDAGQDISPIPIDPDTGLATYNKMKGTFVWKNDVRPVLRYSNGKWKRPIVGVTDKYTEVPIPMAEPLGSYYDRDAMIYPFKMMIGDQPVDPVTKTILVPHLFGFGSGDNPYWANYDWGKALQDGADYTGQDFSGTYEFAETTMLLSVNHEIAPAEQALGMGGVGGACMDCHDAGKVDWDALGWTADPLDGGLRIDSKTLRRPIMPGRTD